jgi:acyl carrier protein
MTQFSLEAFLPEAAEVLGVPVDQLSLDSGATNVSTWDSIRIVMMAMMIEDIFDIPVSSEQMDEFTSIRRIVELLSPAEQV